MVILTLFCRSKGNFIHLALTSIDVRVIAKLNCFLTKNFIPFPFKVTKHFLGLDKEKMRLGAMAPRIMQMADKMAAIVLGEMAGNL